MKRKEKMTKYHDKHQHLPKYFTDGSERAGKVKWGYLVKKDGQLITSQCQEIEGTAQLAEVMAVVKALEKAVELGHKEVVLTCDSEYVIGEKKEMGKEWMIQNQSQIEIGGALLCSSCRTTHPKIRIDSYRVSGNGEKCSCTWDGTRLRLCGGCVARDRKLESSRSVWESLRVTKPLGFFREGIVTRFSRHPYIGMRESEKKAFLQTRYPIFPNDTRDSKDRAQREREELVKEIVRKDRENDLTSAESESMRWNLTLWMEPLKKCFPEVNMRMGSRGKLAWTYVRRGLQWQIRSWGSLAIEIAQEGGWVNSPDYNKDFRGSQIRSNVTKEKRTAKRKEKFEELEVAPVKDIEEHKVWGIGDNVYTVGIPYSDGQVIEEPQEKVRIVMHLKMNVLVCAHPDYDWIGGLEVELHKITPDIVMMKQGSIFKRSRRLVEEPKN
ncbi:hypothetical protein DPX16_15216 [Anabarilius grahami]|uniref:RNase H type-1 domain-containing protein n=1 Tax=Anabarilius grahami TaxID=495550 RepID=A0A3N0Z9T1_ANAGA|nr:hypothetical protein DPX16_15216 [Anabarilius grahami]